MTSVEVTRDDGAVPAPTQVKIVALLFGLSAASYFCRIAVSIAAPSIMKQFDVSEIRMGWVFSAFLLSYTLFQIPGGWLADRMGGRFMIVASGLGAALFTGLTALAAIPGLGALIGVVPALLLVRIAFGASTAPLYPSCGRIISAWIRPEHQGRALAWIVSAAGVGSAISPVIFAGIIRVLGWRACFLVAGLVAALVIALFQLFMPRRDDKVGSRGEPERGSWLALFTNGNLLLITASYLALNYLQYIFYYWIYYYFGTIRKLGQAQTTIATTAAFVSMAVMTPIGGYLSDRAVKRWGVKHGKRVVPVVGMILSSVFLYVGVEGWDVPTTIILFSLAVGCAIATEGAFWSSTVAVGGRRAGAATGIMNCGGNLGGMLGPFLTPIIAGRFGWSAGLYVASAVMLAGMVAWFFIDPSAPNVAAAAE
jgi:MFS transporter, ACS family, glucarate transporter